MRKYTFLVSMVAHLGVVAAVLWATLTVTHGLPGVRRIWEVVIVRAEMPPPLPEPPAPRHTDQLPDLGIPLVAPDTLPDPHAPSFVDDTLSAEAGVESFGDGSGRPGDSVVDGIGPPPPPAPPAPKPQELQRVGGSVTPPTKVQHVSPVYPSIALAARVQGVVILDAVIAENGTVRELRVLRSIPLLDQAALDAVRQWRFTPTLLNGQPTPVIMTVTVAFNLN